MSNGKGLGRGLSSLFGMFDEENDDNNAKIVHKKEDIVIKGGVEEIDIKQIFPNPNQPRKNFDMVALKELSDSIKIHGIIQPIIVNHQPDNTYLIIAGERRYRASKMAGLKTMPVVIKNYTEQQIKEISLLENIQREDLNPIEAAKGMRELLEVYGWTQDFLADRLGKSRPAIANLLRLLTLHPEVVALIESGKLSAGHARSLVVITDPETQVKLAKLAVSKRVTVRDLEKTVKELQTPKLKEVKIEPSIELRELIDIMQHKFSTKVSFMGNDKKGRIYIDYFNKDDLDRISDLLKTLK